MAGRYRPVWTFWACGRVSVSVVPVHPGKQEAKSSVWGEVRTCRQVEEVENSHSEAGRMRCQGNGVRLAHIVAGPLCSKWHLYKSRTGPHFLI